MRPALLLFVAACVGGGVASSVSANVGGSDETTPPTMADTIARLRQEWHVVTNSTSAGATIVAHRISPGMPAAPTPLMSSAAGWEQACALYPRAWHTCPASSFTKSPSMEQLSRLGAESWWTSSYVSYVASVPDGYVSPLGLVYSIPSTKAFPVHLSISHHAKDAVSPENVAGIVAYDYDKIAVHWGSGSKATGKKPSSSRWRAPAR